MSDALQLVVVTAVAGVALLAIVRPYIRRRGTERDVPCAKCASGNPCEPARPEPDVQPLRLTRPDGSARR